MALGYICPGIAAVLAGFLRVGEASSVPIDGFYLGTLTSADRSIDLAMKLETSEGGLTGSYYYFTPSSGTLKLEGTIATDGTLRLEETPENLEPPTAGAPPRKEKLTGVWSGQFAGGELTGTWKAPGKVRSWSFRLVPSERATSYFDGERHTTNAGSTGPITYVTSRVPGSEHKVPLVTSFGNRRVIAEVNSTLMGAAAGAHCGGPPESDDQSFEGEVSFVGEDVLSVRVIQSWFCGAAYPTPHADRSLVFDLRTGAVVWQSDLFRKDATPEEIAEVLFAWELDQARGGPGSKNAETRVPEGHEGCVEDWTLDSLSRAGIESYHLSSDGLVVEEGFPHVIFACANQVTVPYPALARIAAPGGILERLVKANAGAPMRYRIGLDATSPEKRIVYTP